MTDALKPRIATDDDFDRLGELIAAAFLSDGADADIEAHRRVFEPERTHLIDDAGTRVGTGGVQTRDLTVPGGVIPAAHVTAVAVAATHRRRGLLTSIMNAQLSDIRERGTEPVAVLWASEGAIYGRFGYGLASWHVRYDVDTRETAVAGDPVPGARLRPAVPRESIEVLAEVFERVRPHRPGLSSRSDAVWDYLTADRPASRHGMAAERGVLYERDGRVDGYARFRTKNVESGHGPAGEVAVTEVVAATTDAEAALWRFLFSIDLVRKVQYRFGAVDGTLPHLVTNPKGLGASIGPALWVRIVDVPEALAARRYAAPVDVVLEVSDSLLPENGGRWHLSGGASSAICEATEAEPDVTLDVRELGSVYLGGVALATLETSGLVREHSPGALASLSTAFGWHHGPSALETF